MFLDDFDVQGFSNDEIRQMMKGTLVLSMGAAANLCARGFTDDVGVTVGEWTGSVITGEIIGDVYTAKQHGTHCLTPCRDGVEALSYVYTRNPFTGADERLFPGVTRFANTQGGETIVFCGTPNMPYHYAMAFGMLNETRKKQFVQMLSKRDLLPLYYPEDAEIYLRAGYLDNGEIMAAFFNLGFDQLEDVPFVCRDEVDSVELLTPGGERKACRFRVENGVVRVDTPMNTLLPVVLFIRTKS